MEKRGLITDDEGQEPTTKQAADQLEDSIPTRLAEQVALTLTAPREEVEQTLFLAGTKRACCSPDSPCTDKQNS